MILIELGVNCAGTSLYLSRRFVKKGWKGRRNPHRKNSSYSATRPGRSWVTLSSGSGADRPINSGTLNLALMASTSAGVTVEAIPDGPAGSELTAGGSARQRADNGTALIGGPAALDGPRITTPPIGRGRGPRGAGTWSSSDGVGERSSMGLLPSLMVSRSINRQGRLTWRLRKARVAEGLSGKKGQQEKVEEGEGSVKIAKSPRKPFYSPPASPRTLPRGRRPLRPGIAGKGFACARGVPPQSAPKGVIPGQSQAMGNGAAMMAIPPFPIHQWAFSTKRPAPTSASPNA